MLHTPRRTPLQPQTGTVAAVIGGAHGIGLEVARALATAGYRVAVGDLDGTAARAAAEELAGGAVGIQVDVTETGSITAFLEEVAARCGPLEVLVNSAGVLWVGPFLEEPEAALHRQLAVNLAGAMHCVRLAAPAMVERGSGHLVTIASLASVLPTPGEASYSASKHGVLGYLKTVDRELRGSGVAVSAVMPAVVDTEMARGTSNGGVPILQPADVAAAVLRALRSRRLQVPVPGYAGLLERVASLLPGSLRNALYDRLVPDQVRVADRGARQAYETRYLGDLDRQEH